jgi:antitoxin VapB
MQTAKIFKYGRSQAVHLPAEFRFEGGEVLIRRDPVSGDVVLSAKPASLDAFFRLRDRLLKQAPEDFADFLDERELP